MLWIGLKRYSRRDKGSGKLQLNPENLSNQSKDTIEVKQDSQRWRKRAILLIYRMQICLKPKEKPSNSSMNLRSSPSPGEISIPDKMCMIPMKCVALNLNKQ
ncbi:hypothetical protein QQ045_003333 [Rhodiola kirilowii]